MIVRRLRLCPGFPHSAAGHKPNGDCRTRSPFDRLAWLFQDYTPPLEGYSVTRDYHAYQAAVAEARKNAVNEIDASEGYDALLRLAREASQPGWVGVAIADSTTDKYENDLISLLGSQDSTEANLGASYVERRFEQAGWPWVEGLLERTPALSARQQAILLLHTRDYPKSWQRADELGAEVAGEYWSRFRTWGLGDFAHVLYASERLMKAGRNASALDLTHLYINREGADVDSLLKLAASALEALKSDDPEIGLLRQVSFDQLFTLFYEHEDAVGWERIALLEWQYLPALGFDADPKMLGRLLASAPDMFVEGVTVAYRPASDKQTPQLTKEEQDRAMNAYRLLDEWSTPPGTGEDGQIDEAVLTDWMSRAKRGLEQADRARIGMKVIGRVLAKAPADADGSWPCQAIRNIFRTQRSEQIENGFFLEVINSRGVTSRSPEAGGDQERSLAAKYRRHADECSDQWPRTATLLRSLADYYERDARGEDNSAELRRRGLDE